ncbi:MAG TPA: hypothetical protein VMT59_04010 [Gaiellaceae bacterium]|nr:hypothetical protein [Gaiellaceae bacterium]
MHVNTAAAGEAYALLVAWLGMYLALHHFDKKVAADVKTSAAIEGGGS